MDRLRKAMMMSPGAFFRGHLVTQLMHSPQYQIVSLLSNFSISFSSLLWTMSTILLGS